MIVLSNISISVESLRINPDPGLLNPRTTRNLITLRTQGLLTNPRLTTFDLPKPFILIY